MAVPERYYVFVDGRTAAGLITAARLNGNFDALFNCLDPEVGGLEDTNVKSGAKIVCADRSYSGDDKITGTWEFETFPTVPAASIPDAKLSANVMLASAYASKVVTNGDSHDHVGGDGGAIPEGGLTLSDVTTGDVGTAKHGFCPKAPNDTTKFLRGDGTWAVTSGYSLQAVCAEASSLSDATTYYFGSVPKVPSESASRQRIYVPMAGTIKVAYVFWKVPVVGGTAGSGEDISVYIRLNDTSDTLIATIGDTEYTKVFSNTGLSIAVAQGDYFEIKMVCPTWATNPANISLAGVVYVA